MDKINYLTRTLFLVFILLLIACTGEDNSETSSSDSTTDTATTTETGETVVTDGDGKLEAWLQQVNTEEIPPVDMGEDINYALGYLRYYGAIESLGLDNLIYHGLLVRNKLETGAVTQDTLSQSDQNLLELTEGVEFNPDIDPLEQIAQTPAIREAILGRVVQSQQNLSPEEALASGNIVGIVAPPAPEAVGNKFLVYGQETPDAEFEFIGVVIAADATSNNTQEPYSVGAWDGLTWLGDGAGPYWESLPVGTSGDPANTNEGRPGVLLISEDTFESLGAGNSSN